MRAVPRMAVAAMALAEGGRGAVAAAQSYPKEADPEAVARRRMSWTYCIAKSAVYHALGKCPEAVLALGRICCAPERAEAA